MRTDRSRNAFAILKLNLLDSNRIRSELNEIGDVKVARIVARSSFYMYVTVLIENDQSMSSRRDEE